MSSTSKSSSSSRSPTKRIITELSAYNSQTHPTIRALVPSPSSVLNLQAILVAPQIPAYSQGRWLLSITLPPNYPLAAPTIKFVTPICHPNVDFKTGEICLDLLKDAWTPVLGVVGALEAIGRLLAEPGLDSPLNIEVAALGREGDVVGVRGLVGFYSESERFEGHLEESEGRRS